VSDITVYIPAYNVASCLSRSIESLLGQTLKPAKILVVDDGSRDDSAAIAESYPEVTVVRHDKNRGLAAARNSAFRVASTEFVASLDADCIADKTWLEMLFPHMVNPKIAGAGGCLIEGIQISLADRWRRAHMPQEWGMKVLQNPKFLFGCNNIFRRSAVLDAGGYDERFRTNGEDSDLSRRLIAKKWDFIYDPAARATHLRHDNLKSVLDAYWRWWKFGVNAYATGISLRSVVGHALFVHFRYTFLELFGRDWQARQFELLPIDMLLLLYLFYRDFRLWLASKFEQTF
jgi:GT2 family glycosyltransferase